MHTQNLPAVAFKKIGIIGLGLIGGSLAKAFRTLAGIERIIVADTNWGAVKQAIDTGCVDEGVAVDDPGFVEAFAGCDALFVCTPPHATCELLPRFVGVDIGIVTDVASVKLPIMKAASGLSNFIAGHPMAGSEGSGFEAADTNLFQGATYVMCVPEDTTLLSEDLDAFKALITSIGAGPVVMDPREHDCRVAVISHLPHAAAFALSAIVEDSHDAEMRSLIGGGFRDVTRIAASSPALWTDIMSASEPLAAAIDEYVNLLLRMRDLLVAGNTEELQALLQRASSFRASIPEGLRAAKAAQGLGARD